MKKKKREMKEKMKSEREKDDKMGRENGGC